MDSEHRHELKTNDLADWMAHIPEFLKQNASMIIGVALIVIAFLTWPMFTRMRQAADITKAAAVTESIQALEREIYTVAQAAEKDDAARQEATSALLVKANALLEQAAKIDNPDLAALAQIKAAQVLRTELQVRAGRVSVEEVQTRIGQAQEAYQKALKSAGTPTLEAMAKLGLGLCAEELGQRDAAAAIYKEILDTPAFKATVFPAQAQQRLDGLKDNLETFVFTPVPVEPQAAASPTVEVAPQATAPATEVTPPAAPEAAKEAAPTAETTPPTAEKETPAETPAP